MSGNGFSSRRMTLFIYFCMLNTEFIPLICLLALMLLVLAQSTFARTRQHFHLNITTVPSNLFLILHLARNKTNNLLSKSTLMERRTKDSLPLKKSHVKRKDDEKKRKTKSTAAPKVNLFCQLIRVKGCAVLRVCENTKIMFMWNIRKSNRFWVFGERKKTIKYAWLKVKPPISCVIHEHYFFFLLFVVFMKFLGMWSSPISWNDNKT